MFIRLENNEALNNVYLFDYVGNRICAFSLGTLIKNEMKVDISDLPEGLYYLKCETNNKIYITKIVKTI